MTDQRGGFIEYTKKDGSKGRIAASEIDHITRWEGDEGGGIHTKSGDVINVIDVSKVIEQWKRVK